MKRLLFAVVAVVALVLAISCAPKAPPTPAAEPIILGLPTSLYTPEGEDNRDAAILAMEEINAKGGVSVAGVKRPLKIVVSDTRGGEPGVPAHDALLAIEKLIVEQKPHAIVVAPYRSEVMVASMDLFAKYKMVTLQTIAQTPQITTNIAENPEKYKYIFKACSHAGDMARTAGAVLGSIKEEFGFDRIYMVSEDVLWQRGFTGGAKKVCEGQGWNVLAYDTVPHGCTDYSSVFIKATEGKAQVVWVNGDSPQSPIAAKQFYDMKVPALFCSYATPCNIPAAWEALGEKLAWALGNETPAGSQTPVKALPKSIHYIKAFNERWGRDFGTAWTPAYAYDSVYIIADAIERAGSLDPDKLIAAVEKTDMPGVGGRIRFDENHKLIFNENPEETQILLIFQWRPGGIRLPVYPDIIAEGKIELPPWMK